MTKTIDFECLKQTILYMQVCANIKPTDYKAKKQLLNLLPPSGTENGWCSYPRDKKFRPVPCDDREGYFHYIVNC